MPPTVGALRAAHEERMRFIAAAEAHRTAHRISVSAGWAGSGVVDTGDMLTEQQWSRRGEYDL